jgi:AcrR family transcriptional regulator
MHRKDITFQPLAPRRTPRQKRSQILFDKILSTAKTLFKQHGYAYVSTNTIAEKANISIGSLYHYFSNCESIALAVYEDACSKAALTLKRRALESLSIPLATSIPQHIAWTFDLFEKDRYALLQLINEVPQLRRVNYPFSFDCLIHHTTQMYLEHHFSDIARSIIARKAYIIDKCVVAIIGRYLDEKPDFLSKQEAIAEISEMIEQYVTALERFRKNGLAGPRGITPTA